MNGIKYLKNPSQELRKSFSRVPYESQERLDGKTRKGNYFKVQSGRITV